jgi:DNA-binding transcriptional LysR family regulator
MWDTVELRELRVFLALTEELHFGRTAERLGISQSRVSQTIRTLEGQLGVRLFERTSRRVALTSEGEQLRADIAGLHAELSERLARFCRGSRAVQGKLVVAHLTPTALPPQFHQVIGAFLRRYPTCEVALNDHLYGVRAVQALVDGTADVLVSWLPVHQPGLARGPVLQTAPRVLAVARGHPLASRPEVTLEDVADYPVAPSARSFPPEIVNALVPERSPSGRPIRRVASPQTTMDAVSLVARGETVHPTVPAFARIFAQEDVVLVPLAGCAPLRSALLWRKGSRDPKIAAFAELAASICAEANRPARSRRPQLRVSAQPAE